MIIVISRYFTHKKKSMSITLNQNHTLLSKEKIPTLFLQRQPMQAVLWHKMENDLEMEMQAIQNVSQNGKRLMIRMKRWKLMTTRKHHKRMIYVCHTVHIMLDIYFTSLVLFEKAAAPSSVPTQVQQPSLRLLCTNLPQVVTNDVLSVLFQQYDTS